MTKKRYKLIILITTSNNEMNVFVLAFLNKVFDKITATGKFVIVVDNFDFIDL